MKKNISFAKLLIHYLKHIYPSTNEKIYCMLHKLNAEYYARRGLHCEAEFRYLIATDPSKYDAPATVYRSYGEHLIEDQGNIEDGMRKLKKASQMKESPNNDYVYGTYLTWQRKYKEAHEVLKDLLRHNPGNWKYLCSVINNLYYWDNPEYKFDLIYTLKYALPLVSTRSPYRKDVEWCENNISYRWEYRYYEDIIRDEDKTSLEWIITNEGEDKSFSPYKPHGAHRDGNSDNHGQGGSNHDDSKSDSGDGCSRHSGQSWKSVSGDGGFQK